MKHIEDLEDLEKRIKSLEDNAKLYLILLVFVGFAVALNSIIVYDKIKELAALISISNSY